MSVNTSIIRPITLIVGILLFLFSACSPAAISHHSSAKSAIEGSNTSSQRVVRSEFHTTVALKSMPNGTVIFDWTPTTDDLTITITLTGLTPWSLHPAHVHMGSCSTPGKVLYSLQSLVADSHGRATSLTTIPYVTTGIPSHGWYVNVHNGPALDSPEEAVQLACADIHNPQPATTHLQHGQTHLIGKSFSQQEVTGEASLTFAPDQLSIQLSLNGLEPDITYEGYIILGRCTNLGKRLYSLQPVTGNSSGNGTSTTIITKVSAIPVHNWVISIQHTEPINSFPVACGEIDLIPPLLHSSIHAPPSSPYEYRPFHRYYRHQGHRWE